MDDDRTSNSRCPRCSRGDLLRAGLGLAAGVAAAGAWGAAPLLAAGVDTSPDTLPLPTPIPEIDRFGHHNVPPAPYTEPSEIFNFRGRVATAVLAGTGHDDRGTALRFGGPGTDVRFMQGEYVAADGSHHSGTFVHL